MVDANPNEMTIAIIPIDVINHKDNVINLRTAIVFAILFFIILLRVILLSSMWVIKKKTIVLITKKLIIQKNTLNTEYDTRTIKTEANKAKIAQGDIAMAPPILLTLLALCGVAKLYMNGEKAMDSPIAKNAKNR